MKTAMTKLSILAAVLATGTALATTPRYTMNGEGASAVVADAATSLTWQATPTSSALDWKSALAHCEALSQCNHDDWRLPDVLELMSIIDERKTQPPALNETYFQGFASVTGLWTSTSGRRDGKSAYVVYVNEQNATVGRGGSGLLVKTAKVAALCVRGGMQ
jgi:hypothetical protein